MSLIETAKANHLNIYQYLYTLLLYMPDYKNEPAGIKQLMPWSEFIKENCSGITDTEKILPEKCKLRLNGTVIPLIRYGHYETTGTQGDIVPIKRNGCTADFRMGVPFERNLHGKTRGPAYVRSPESRTRVVIHRL